MGVFGRIVKVNQKSTLLWWSGQYHTLNFKTKHNIGDIIDSCDNLITKNNSSYNHKSNEGLFSIMKNRFDYIQKTRDFFRNLGFIEVTTPKLKESIIDETNISIMKTPYGYLTPSPEVEIKKLISLGFDNVFELCYAYRDDHKDNLHKKEFLILEWYRAMQQPKDIIRDFIELIKYLNEDSLLKYQGLNIDLDNVSFIKYKDLFLNYANIDIHNIDKHKIKKMLNIEGEIDVLELLDAVFAFEIEKNLGLNNPIVVYDFPKEKATLARIENGYAKRYETYIAGIELSNCYLEETDYKEIKRRFKNTDKLFFDAMKKGIPKMSGIAVGLDRLIMILENLEKVDCF